MLVFLELGSDFSRGCAWVGDRPLTFRDPPRHPALCTETKYALPSAPITHGNLQHDLPREEPLLPNTSLTSLNRGPREGSAAIVSL
jgi:hypothetical protein